MCLLFPAGGEGKGPLREAGGRGRPPIPSPEREGRKGNFSVLFLLYRNWRLLRLRRRRRRRRRAKRGKEERPNLIPGSSLPSKAFSSSEKGVFLAPKTEGEWGHSFRPSLLSHSDNNGAFFALCVRTGKARMGKRGFSSSKTHKTRKTRKF